MLKEPLAMRTILLYNKKGEWKNEKGAIKTLV